MDDIDKIKYVEGLFSEIEYIDDSNELYYDVGELSRDELVETLVEIAPLDTDTFLQVKETLTRIGIANRAKKTLYQSCMVLHKKGKFYICHFKELFGMDGKSTKVLKEDYSRRNHIARLLQQWKLIKIINNEIIQVPSNEPQVSVYVLPFKDKRDWILESKYAIGTVPNKEK